jgi:chitinase
VEHVLDGNLIGQFMRDAAAGRSVFPLTSVRRSRMLIVNNRLRSGAIARAGPIAISYFVTAQTEPMLLGSSPLPGGADPAAAGNADLQYVFGRVMECLGSEFNDAYFVALVVQIHTVKTQVRNCLVQYLAWNRKLTYRSLHQFMRGNRPMSVKNLQKRATSGKLEDAQYILGKIRATIGSVRYLSHTGTPDVAGYLTSIINNAGAQWRHSQQVYNANHPNDQTAIGDFWSEWVKDFYTNFVLRNARAFAREAIDALRETWTNSADAGAQAVIDALTSLDTQLKTMAIDTSLWF